MKRLKITTIVLLAFCSSTLVEAKAGAEVKSDLEVLDIKLEPIRKGKNVVRIKVQNNSDEDQDLSIDIRTESSTGNWQTQFPHIIKGSETKWVRQAYKINGIIVARTRIRLRFYMVGSTISSGGQGTNKYFKEAVYFAGDLQHAEPDDSKPEPASEDQRRTIAEVLRQFQKCVRNNDYEGAWQFFSQDFKEAELFGRLSTFQRAMETPYFLFPLSRAEVLALEPKSAGRKKGTLGLTTALKDEHWMVNFVKVADNWCIDTLERIDAAPREQIPFDPDSQEQAVRKAFGQWQDSIRDGKYKTAWELFASGLRRSRQYENDFQRFAQKMGSNGSMMRAISLNLRSESVTNIRIGKFATLNTTHSSRSFRIDFVMEDGQWKICNIRMVRDGNGGDWQARLLPRMRKRVTKHFDIFCFKGSTAEKEIDKIAEERERGFREICQFLGKDSDVRIRMILFEDGATKYSETGHQGAGWAFGNTVVEVYNEKQKLDPYHETTHVLMRPYGSPPALFNEGLAVYMSERLGAPALVSMGGGESSIYERVGKLNGKGEWIELEELMTYTEIGSGKTNPPVAYPEAASFVKFLVETYGKDKFLKTYRTLRNSNDKATQEQNVKALETIYGKSLDDLKTEWKRTFPRSK
ncbi:MAG: hypothetical protein GWN67_01250 [Phycisphaerae bacterium]|nr:hypothetical protein [Phycisphaerae bacterium]NIP50584.1 hypothetical protein [Phycisphaerae bacterium]NIS50795.1 hypothetical protein [Phycisphaerae bacterium]NIU07472.1 hypothetical protein [Phycisphaerae bacterium]NIU55062.1 hypothetical protein [Phycisphaerae bacterium]